MKATSKEDHDRVAYAASPSQSKDVGRSIELRSDWGNNKYDLCWYVMLEIELARTLQHYDILELLALTGDRHIYEDSPVDDIWGWRYRGIYNGKNLLGETWMEVRRILF